MSGLYAWVYLMGRRLSRIFNFVASFKQHIECKPIKQKKNERIHVSLKQMLGYVIGLCGLM